MIIKSSLVIVKRCLAGLDRLEDEGASVNVIRADLSTVADRLESLILAEGLERRRRAIAVAGESDNPCDPCLEAFAKADDDARSKAEAIADLKFHRVGYWPTV